jgi:hypothetical protein
MTAAIATRIQSNTAPSGKLLELCDGFAVRGGNPVEPGEVFVCD